MAPSATCYRYHINSPLKTKLPPLRRPLRIRIANSPKPLKKTAVAERPWRTDWSTQTRRTQLGQHDPRDTTFSTNNPASPGLCLVSHTPWCSCYATLHLETGRAQPRDDKADGLASPGAVSQMRRKDEQTAGADSVTHIADDEGLVLGEVGDLAAILWAVMSALIQGQVSLGKGDSTCWFLVSPKVKAAAILAFCADVRSSTARWVSAAPCE